MGLKLFCFWVPNA